jgi:hypothetical protein
MCYLIGIIIIRVAIILLKSRRRGIHRVVHKIGWY